MMMISLDLTKSSEVRKTGDQPNTIVNDNFSLSGLCAYPKF